MLRRATSVRPRHPRHRAGPRADAGLSPAFQRPAAAAQAQAPYFPERLDWQQKKPEEVGMNAALMNEAVQLAIAADTPGPNDMALFLHNSFGKEPFNTLVGPVKDRGAGERHHHPPRLHRRGVGRPEPRRHHQQRHEDVSDDGRRAGVAEGLIKDVNDYARDYMPPHVDLFDVGAQPEDQVGSSAAPDQRLAGHAVGQAGLGGSSGRRHAGRLGEPQAVGAGHALQVQRRPRQRDGAGGAAGVAAAAAGGAARGSDGADRRLVDVAVVRLRELVGRHRRQEGAVGERRRPLGRRHVHQLVRHGALRLPVPAQRQVEGQVRSSRRSGSRWRGRRDPTTRPTASRTGI